MDPTVVETFATIRLTDEHGNEMFVKDKGNVKLGMEFMISDGGEAVMIKLDHDQITKLKQWLSDGGW